MMKFLFTTVLFFLFFTKGFSQNSNPVHFLFENQWILTATPYDSLNETKNPKNCIYYISFKKNRYKKKENKFQGNIFISRKNCSDTNIVYPFVSRYEILLEGDTLLHVKKVDHLNFNNTIQKDPFLKKCINFFMINKLKLVYVSDSFLLSNLNNETIKLIRMK
jgi:hypothetical protein